MKLTAKATQLHASTHLIGVASLLSVVQCAHVAHVSPTFAPVMTSSERERSDAFAQRLVDVLARHEQSCGAGQVAFETAADVLASTIEADDLARAEFRDAESHFLELEKRERSDSVKLDLEVLAEAAGHRRKACEWTRVRREALPNEDGAIRRREAAYAFALEGWGIEAAPKQLAKDARLAFREIQLQAQGVAIRVARERNLDVRDYRDVLKVLKREQIPTTELISRYRSRQTEIEGLLRKADIISLPTRELRIRLGSREESARMPAPRYDPAPLLRRDEEPGVFVIPLLAETNGDATFDDFGFDGGMWWLTAHEGRPGHDLQYSKMAEHRPSRARREFAARTATVEGWGLYAESLIEPLVPNDARLAILQARMMRAAHAFLDIELNLGVIDESEVRRVMVEDVGFSRAWADACIRRYKVLMPGQAPSYFYGYQQLLNLRHETELRFGSRFEVKAFHDAVIEQGLLPLRLLRLAILSEGGRGPTPERQARRSPSPL